MNKNALPALPEKEEAQTLSIQYSHPAWLVKRLLTLLGREEAEAFLRLDNEIAPLTLQVNPLQGDMETLLDDLTAAGVTARRHAWIPGCLELTGAGNLTALPGFSQGKFLVQDGAAALVAQIAGVHAGQRVLDVCAAPGGKSFSAAFAMEDRGSILACDLHENKLVRIREGAARLGLKSIETAAADGRTPCADWQAGFDVVLVDAPCSGLGIIRKKPDIRYKKPDDLLTLPEMQSEILSNAATYVRPGGTLLYSTCTILPEENEQVTEAFLAEHADFSRETFVLPDPVGVCDGHLTLWPHRHGTDGFYICRMTRRG